MKILSWFKKDLKKPTVDEITVGNLPTGYGKLETNSLTWRFLSNNIIDRIETLRKKNDNPALSIEKTTLIRGEIKGLKRILDLPNHIDD